MLKLFYSKVFQVENVFSYGCWKKSLSWSSKYHKDSAISYHHTPNCLVWRALRYYISGLSGHRWLLWKKLKITHICVYWPILYKLWIIWKMIAVYLSYFSSYHKIKYDWIANSFIYLVLSFFVWRKYLYLFYKHKIFR